MAAIIKVDFCSEEGAQRETGPNSLTVARRNPGGRYMVSQTLPHVQYAGGSRGLGQPVVISLKAFVRENLR